MSIRQRVAQFLFKAAFQNVSAPGSYLWTNGKAEWTDYDYRSYAEMGYLANPYLYSAIDMIMTAIKGIKVNAMIPGRNQNGEPSLVDMPTGHPAYNLISKPCEFYPSLATWAAVMTGYKMLGGAAYALAMGPDPRGTVNPRPPVMLHPLGPNCMAVKPAVDENGNSRLGYIGGFEYQPGKGAKIDYNKDEVFWWGTWNPENEYKGTSVCKPGEKTLDTNNSARNYNKVVLDNGGFVGTVFSTDNPNYTREQAEQHQKSFDEKYKGSSKAGKTFFADHNLKPYKVGLTPAEMGFEQLINMTAREVGVITHVPSQLLGDTSIQTYANFAEAREALYTEATIPQFVELLNLLAPFINLRFKNAPPVTFAVDIDSITALSAQREKSKDSLRKDYQAGLITKTEARQEIGWSAEDDGGEFYTGSQPTILQTEGKSWAVNLQKKGCNHG
jgi:HK97 family phage portal protein